MASEARCLDCESATLRVEELHVVEEREGEASDGLGQRAEWERGEVGVGSSFNFYRSVSTSILLYSVATSRPSRPHTKRESAILIQ